MKKMLLALGLLVAAAHAFADSTTTRLGITKPSIGSTGWGTKTNSDWDLVDSTVGALGQANIFTASNTFVGPTIFSTQTLGQMPYIGASGLLSFLSTGTAGYVLQANAAAAPSWVSLASGGAGVLSATQTWTGGNTYNSWTVLSGSATLTNASNTLGGNGAALTSLTAANVTGSHTLPDGVLSTNVPLLNAVNVWTGASNTFQSSTIGFSTAASPGSHMNLTVNTGATESAVSFTGIARSGMLRTAIDLRQPSANWGVATAADELSIYGTGDGSGDYHRMNVGWNSYRNGVYSIGEEESGGTQAAVGQDIGVADHTNGVNRESIRIEGFSSNYTLGTVVMGNFAQKTGESVTDFDPTDILVLRAPDLISNTFKNSPSLVFVGQGFNSSAHTANWRFRVETSSQDASSSLFIASKIDSAAYGTMVQIGNDGTLYAAKLSASGLAAHGVTIGEGAAAIVGLPAMANGGLVIGAGTGVDPATGTLTAGSGITVTNAAGSITVAETTPTVGTGVTIQTFTSGSGTYNTPANVKWIRVRIVGGGGGGGGVATASAQSAAGAGGGGGGYSEKVITSPAGSYSYSVSSGAIGGTAGNNAGQTAANTTFSTLTAGGGAGGSGSAATATFPGIPAGDGAAGGGASGGDINIAGSPGGSGFVFTVNSAIGGAGGASGNHFGSGAIAKNPNNAGQAGATFGGGGGGGAQVNNGGTQAGGAGAAGIVTVEEHYNY